MSLQDQFMLFGVGLPIIFNIFLFLIGIKLVWDSLFLVKRDEETSIPPVWAGIAVLFIAVVLGIFLLVEYLPKMYEIFLRFPKT